MQLIKKNWEELGSLFWHYIKSDVERFIKNCDQCQKKEKIKKVLTDLQMILVKSKVIQQIDVDIVIYPGFKTYNQFQNILRLFNVLPNFSFTTSETMGGYYL